MWDAETGKQAATPLGEHTATAFALAVSPDGKFLATACADKIGRVYSMKSIFADRPVDGGAIDEQAFYPRKPVELKGHVETVRAVCVSHDSKRIVTGSYDTKLIVWLRDGTKCAVLTGHSHRVRCVDLTPDNHLLSSSDDGTVRVWTNWMSTDPSLREARVWRASKKRKPTLWAVAASVDRRYFFAGGDDKVVSMVSLDTLKTVRQLLTSGGVSSLCPTVDGQALLIGSFNKHASIQMLSVPNSPNDGLEQDWHQPSEQDNVVDGLFPLEQDRQQLSEQDNVVDELFP